MTRGGQSVPPMTHLPASIMPPCNPVEKLHRLNRTSSGFHNQLSGVLYEEEYGQWVKNIDNDMVWLVDFLDKVRRRTAFVHPTLAQTTVTHRLSMFSILLVPLSGSVYASSEGYAARGQFSQHRARIRLIFSTLAPIRSPPEVLGMCTRELSTVRRFASSASGYILGMIHKRLRRRVIGAVAFLTPHSQANGAHRPSAKKPLFGNA